MNRRASSCRSRSAWDTSGARAFTPGAISLGDSAYMLLSRLAYVDIFGSVIDVQEAAPEPMPMRQWRDSIGHVLTPRFLFPTSRCFRIPKSICVSPERFATEDVRMGTSISVGYMGENFADLGFPGMLVGIAVLGLIIAGVIRIVMSFNLPLMVREGIVMALAFVMSRDGVEVSLAKTLGGMVMFLLVFLLLNKFVFGRVMVWLNHQGPAIEGQAFMTVFTRPGRMSGSA